MAEFEGTLPPTPAYLKFRVSNETLKRITGAATPDRAVSAFDLDIREQLSTVTYQHPDNIADGIRLVSQVELGNTAAVFLGSTEATRVSDAKALRKDLSIIVQRRNKIAHEGDLQPTAPRLPWPIAQADLRVVAQKIESIVRAIDAII